MNELYEQSEYDKVTEQKKQGLTVYFILLGVTLAVCVCILVYFTTLEYKTPKKTLLLTLEGVISGLFAIYSFLHLGIKVKRASSYQKMLWNILNLEQVEGKHTFIRHEKDIVVKNGVDFTSLVFLEWSDKKHEFYETKIYLDNEKKIPEFKKGDIIYHKTHSNILTAYDLRNDNIFE